jgi:CHAT domain-containing protein/Tfp pilus assembly protein PilF
MSLDQSMNRLLTVLLCFSNLGVAGPIRQVGAFLPQTQVDSGQVIELKAGSPVDREMKGGQAHNYQVKLSAGQYLHVVAEQHGIDIAMALSGPDGKKLVDVDSPNGAEGPEVLSWIAESDGTYRVEIRSVDKNAAAGRYKVTVEPLRPATAKDRSRIQAEEAIRSAWMSEANGSLQGAAEAYLRALPLWQAAGDVQGEANTYARLGEVCRYRGDLSRAFDHFSQELLLRREMGDRSSEAVALNNLGVVCDYLGDKRKALDYYNQALLSARKPGDRLGEAAALNNIGGMYDSLGEKQKALDYYNQALPIMRQVGDRSGEARTLSNIGLVYNSLGEKRKALEYFSQALPISREVGDRSGEARTLSNIGLVYNSLGEKQKALDYYNQALPIRRQVGDRLGEATILNNIGGVYNELGENQTAMEYYNQALRISRQVGDRSGEATTLDNIGSVYSSLGEKQKALEYYNQALPIRRQVGDRSGEGATLNNIGLVFSSLGEKQKALDYYNQALPIILKVGDRSGEATTLNNIGGVYEGLEEKQKALDYYNHALPIMRQVGDRRGEAATLHLLSRAHRDLGNESRAESEIQTAISIAESLRTKIIDPGLRSSYSATFQDYYSFYIDLLMQGGKGNPTHAQMASAFEVSESSRARSLIDLLSESHVEIRQGVDPKLLESERSLGQLLNTKAQALSELLAGNHTEEQVAAAKKEIDGLAAQYEEVEARIRATSPRYAALTQPQPLSLADIQKQLDRDTLLLEYSLGTERSYLWAVTSNSLSGYQLPKQEEIGALTRFFYHAITRSNGEHDARELERSGHRLSAVLLGQVRSIKTAKRLVIVADGELQYIPFAALPVPDPNPRGPSVGPLILAHEIVNLPSASVIAVQRRWTAGRDLPPRALAVIADPVFSSDDARVKSTNGGSRPRQFELPRLPGTRMEADHITSLAAVGQSREVLGFAATKAAATSPELAHYRYVHFATHAFVDATHPELSGIVLSLVDERGEPQDGFLRTWEVFNLNLPAEMVVLSGCQTGLGKEVRGEGSSDLARAFMYAGAKRVLASLWGADDLATAELMTRMYRGILKEGKPPAEALRQAQVEVYRDKRWRSPYYWAPFVLQGEWQ